MCINCGSDEVELCSCQDGKHSWGVTSASTLVTSASFVLTMSTVGQYSGAWAAVNEHVFIQGFGYYKVVSSTSSTISLTEPASPFVGGAAFAANTVDFQSQAISGNYTIASGTKVTPAGLKGTTGTAGVAATLEGVFHGATTTADINPASTSYLTLATENIAAASLIDVGDSLRIKACYYFSPGISTGSGNIKILFGGVSITEFSGIEPPVYDIFPYIEVECIVSRVDNVTVDVRTFLKWAGKGSTVYSSEEVTAGPTSHTYTTYQIIGATVSALTLATTVLFQGKVASVGPPSDIVKLGYYLVENLQKI